jgi:hypothetical protein
MYPGAVKERPPSPNVTMPKMCGRAVTIVSYHASADPKTVAGWYKAHVSGGAFLDTSNSDEGTHDSSFQIYTADGSAVVVIQRLDFSGANLSAAAKTLGMDKTDIGIESFEPPLGANFVALAAQSRNGDAASKAAAKKQMASLCPPDKD